MAVLKHNSRRAFTLVELMVTLLAAMVVVGGVTAMLFYGHKGYNALYRRVTSDVVVNAYEARKVFDAIVRKSTIERCDIIGGNELYVYYYYDETPIEERDLYLTRLLTPAVPPWYAKFYLDGTDLKLEQGAVDALTFIVDPSTNQLPPFPILLDNPEPRTRLLAENVVACTFAQTGAAVRMIFRLDDESGAEPYISKISTLKLDVATTAIRHNMMRRP